MTIHRLAAKRDVNEAEIVLALQYAGATVVRLSQKGVPDLLVGFNGHNFLFEVKTPKGSPTPDQVTFFETWEGSVHIVRSTEDALRIISQ